MVLETLVFSPFNHLTRLVARENFIKLELRLPSVHSKLSGSFAVSELLQLNKTVYLPRISSSFHTKLGFMFITFRARCSAWQ
jgi:hypothetical protein